MAVEGGLNPDVLFSPGGIAPAVGGPIEGYGRGAYRRSHVDRPRVSPHDEIHLLEEGTEPFERKFRQHPHVSADAARDRLRSDPLAFVSPGEENGRFGKPLQNLPPKVNPPLLVPKLGRPGGAVMEKDGEAVGQGCQQGLGRRVILGRGKDIGGDDHPRVVLAKGNARHPQGAAAHVVVLAAERHLVGGKEEIEGLPHPLPVEAEAAPGPRQPGDEPALEVTLDVEGDVVGCLAKRLPERLHLPAGPRGEGMPAPLPGFHDVDLPQQRVPVENLPVPFFHHPVDFDTRHRLTEIVEHRQGVDDVTKGGNFDDEDSNGHACCLQPQLADCGRFTARKSRNSSFVFPGRPPRHASVQFGPILSFKVPRLPPTNR